MKREGKEEMAGARALVWIVDAEQWPRACIRAELIERGFDAIGFEDLASALQSLRNPLIAKPRAIVIELRGLNTISDGLQTLGRTGIPTLVLCGAREMGGGGATLFPGAKVIRRPFSIDEVTRAIEKLVSRST